MKQLWRVTIVGSALVAAVCSGSSARSGQQKLSMDDQLRVAVLRYQIHHVNVRGVCLLVGGTWAENHGRGVVIHHWKEQPPTFAVTGLVIGQGLSPSPGVPIHLVGDGPILGAHSSATVSVAALRLIDLSHATAYGAVRYCEPAGSGGEGNVTFYTYRLSHNASGWTVTAAKSVTGFG